jgi:hypothetical protein
VVHVCAHTRTRAHTQRNSKMKKTPSNNNASKSSPAAAKANGGTSSSSNSNSSAKSVADMMREFEVHTTFHACVCTLNWVTPLSSWQETKREMEKLRKAQADAADAVSKARTSVSQASTSLKDAETKREYDVTNYLSLSVLPDCPCFHVITQRNEQAVFGEGILGRAI